MIGYYLTAEALGYLALFILALGITLYLTTLKNKQRPTWLFLAFFACMTLYAAVSLVEGTALWVARFYAVHVQVICVSLALVPLLQFAYLFPQAATAGDPPLRHAREARLLLILSLAATGGVVAWAIYQIAQLTPEGNPTTATTFSDIWIALGFLWVVVTFWRRTWQLSRAEDPTRPWWQHLRHPEGRAAQGTASFALVFTLAAGLSVVLVLGEFVPGVPILTIPSLGALVVLFFLAIAYFNHAPQTTSFLVKLVGISLVTSLLMIGLAGALVTPPDALLRGAELTLSPPTYRFEPTSDGGYTLTSLPARFDEAWGTRREEDYYPLPFPFLLFGRPRSQIYLSREARLIFADFHNAAANRYNLRPIIHVLDSPYTNTTAPEIFAKEEATRYVVTWLFPPDEEGEPETVVQGVLEAGGAFELRYQHVDRYPVRRIGVFSGNGQRPANLLDLEHAYTDSPVPPEGLIVDLVLPHQRAVHETLLPLAYLSLVGSLLIVLGFPLFFSTFLVQPLHALVRGVRAVDEGDLTVQVPIRFPDEIGLVTEAFNRMVTSVREADERLEAQVQARTRELAASEARYRELFEAMTGGVAVLGAVADGADFVVQSMNRAGARMEGIAQTTLVGRHLSEFAPPAQNEVLWQAVRLAAEGEPLSSLSPLRYRTTSGGWREVTAYKLPSAEIVLLFDDVTAQLQAESQRAQLAAMAERERIGRELHDDLGQVLGFVSVQSQAVRTLLNSGQVEQATAALEQLVTVAQSAHTDVREYILGIRTAPEQRQASFIPLLQSYLQTLEEQYGLHSHLSLPETLAHIPLASEVETQLLRIIQEALTNIRKHATAPEARLLFTLHRDELQVVISDDGPGFDLAEAPATEEAHFGLRIMQERAAQVGGTVEVRTQPGTGTTLIVCVPRVLPPVASLPAGLRVLLVDDHRIYLEGLRTLLMARGVQVVGCAYDGLEAQAQARTLRPDLILMDIHMPHCDGLEATRRIKTDFPEIKIVVLTVAAEGALLFEALKVGASGYLLKNLGEEEFYALLAKVLAGETVLSPDLATRLLTESQQPGSDTEEPIALTQRQIEVLEQLAEGKSNKGIALALHVSENTVKYHISEILARLSLSSRHQLSEYAQQRGLGGDHSTPES